jgi:hypothetical protein
MRGEHWGVNGKKHREIQQNCRVFGAGSTVTPAKTLRKFTIAKSIYQFLNGE